MISVAEVDAIAEEAHAGQYRKFGGGPYVEHPRRVAEAVRQQSGIDTKTVMVALLHDVLEDTDLTAADLLARHVPSSVVGAVQVLTRGDETYGEYLDRVILSGDLRATTVKKADLRDNLRDLPLGNSLRARYEAALRRMEGTR